uniref:Uncharacterized protein n=1 Tax=Solanum lycopersicum TaxID=4081 RepID=A0A3Q7FU84_SOLLC
MEGAIMQLCGQRSYGRKGLSVFMYLVSHDFCLSDSSIQFVVSIHILCFCLV